MNNFLNRNWFFISMVAGIMFLAFSAMIQSWLLAITTLIFMGLEAFAAKIRQEREEEETREAIEKFESGKINVDEKVPGRFKIPATFVILALFVLIALLELGVILIMGY